MISNRGILSVFLLLLATIALLDGLAVPLIAAALILMLSWPQLPGLKLHTLRSNFSRKGLIIIALLMAWPMLSSMWSIDPRTSFSITFKNGLFLLIGLFGIALARLRAPHDDLQPWECLASGLLVAVFAVALETLPGGGLLYRVAELLDMSGPEYYTKDLNRGLAVLTILIWPAVIGFALSGKARFALLLPIMVAPAILFMHSLSAKMGVMAGLAVFYAMVLRPRLSKNALLIGLPLLFALWPLLFHFLEPTLRSPSIYMDLPQSSRHRIEIWHFTLEKWSERPWLGWGAYSSRIIPGGNDIIRDNWVFLPMHPHSVPMHILLEQGIVGFGLTIAALAIFLRQSLSLTPQQPVVTAAIGAAFSAYIVICLSGYSMWQAWWVLTPVVAALLVMHCLYERKQL